LVLVFRIEGCLITPPSELFRATPLSRDSCFLYFLLLFAPCVFFCCFNFLNKVWQALGIHSSPMIVMRLFHHYYLLCSSSPHGQDVEVEMTRSP
ncbi:hypothetical protein LINPERHAP1_LOCUS28455, partial [Linum perenne]